MSDQERDNEVELTGEEGHAAPALLALVGAAGAIALGVAVATDSDVLAIIAGVGTAVGILLGSVAEHMTVDYDVFRRLEDLEKK